MTPFIRNSIGAASLALAVFASGCNAQDAGDRPLTDDRAKVLLAALQEAPSHGFTPRAFPIEGLAGDLHSANPEIRRKAGIRLRDEILAYARAQRGLDPAPGKANAYWGMRPEKYDAKAEYNRALAENRLGEWLKSLPPPQPEYEALREANDTYMQIAQAGDWPTIPAGSRLVLGSRDPRVQTLRARLAFEDKAVDNSVAAPFDAALAAAVSRFQTRYGLEATGAVDEKTRAALNISAAARAAQIRANMQRWRWAPRENAPTRVIVNSAAGVADIFVDGAPAMHMRVATGKPGDETPLISSKIHTIVLNPTWNVPDSIATEELLPKEESDPGYLERNNFTVTQDGEATRVVQQPGANNALGAVKFLFDSPYSIYLHDTPSREAFGRVKRAVSHGCVRLERAHDLAKLFLGRESGWNASRVDETWAGGETTDVKLSQQIPVQIYYWTAFVENGQVQFRDDIYGWDGPSAKLADRH